jgi:PAS domain S-box-containing protein
MIILAVAARGTGLIAQFAPRFDGVLFNSVLEALFAILGVALVLHLALDLLVLRRRRRRRESLVQESRLAAAVELSAALARTRDRQGAGRVLLDTLNELIGGEFSGLMLVDESGTEARGLIARAGGADVSWYPSVRLELEDEASGTRRAYTTHAAFSVENTLESSDVNKELIERAGLKSATFLPLESVERILGVIMMGSTSAPRPLTSEQLALAKMLVAEGTLALERRDSLVALERALERERLVAEISRRVRSELDLERVIEVALAETGKALGVVRCFIRLGEPSSAAPLRAEWRQEGIEPTPASATPFLAVSNLALRERRTVAVADIEKAPELDDESLGGRTDLLELGSRAVLATPIILFGSVIGALAAHTTAVRHWSRDDVMFLEAIARELGIALHTAGLLDENRLRIEQQEELLAATEAMTVELELDTVLARKLAGGRADLVSGLGAAAVMAETVRQTSALLDADASLLLELEGSELVVREGTGEGIEGLIGRRFPAAISLAGDIINSRRPLAVNDLAQEEHNRLESLDPIVPPGFQALMGVPVVGTSDVLDGVLIVYSREIRPWRTKETDALTSLAANTAAALANAALYLRVSLEREQSLAILSSVADGIVAVDRDDRIVLWNAAAERITGISSSEALGRTGAEVLRQDLGSKEEPGEQSISIKRRGREQWLAVTESVMRDPADQIAGKIYTLRDVSADHLVEQAKSDFVSSISHELRAPLTSIYGFAETLLRRGELFDEVQRQTFLSYIASESERLAGIVDALLDVAELDSGDLQVELARIDVARVVREVVESARLGESGKENGHEFVIDLAADTISAEADRDKLRRVLGNLVDNAIKFSPAGGKVTVAGRKNAGVVELKVEDEGVGVPEEERERIFRKFYRGSSSALSGGTGLGLFISRGLVAAMGGRIWVDSVEGQGSTFVLELAGDDKGGEEE